MLGSMSTTPLRIAILSVSAGAGHVRAAEALRLAAEARGCSAVHLDLMELVPTWFRKVYKDSYLGLVERRPALWGYLYHTSDRARTDSLGSKLRTTVEGLSTRKLHQALAEAKPDVVICTHFLPAQILSRERKKGRFDQPTWVVVTDFDVHQLWVHPHLSGYAVAADEVAVRLQERLAEVDDAIPSIAVTGIPIMPAFATPPDRATCARELGLDPTRPTFLLMSGGFGIGAIDGLAERILGLGGPLQLVALAGKNQELLKRLQTLATQHPGRLFPQGFTSTPERLMALADVAVSKPGGLTTAECLAMSLPMVVISPIPGQEERNADYLLEHGAGLKAHDAAGVIYRVKRLLDDPALIQRLRVHAKSIGRARAAADILNVVLAQH